MKAFAVVDKNGAIQKATVGNHGDAYELCIAPTEADAQQILDEGELTDCRVVPVTIARSFRSRRQNDHS